MNSTDFEKIRLPLNFNLDNVYATGYAIKIENTETDTKEDKGFFEEVKEKASNMVDDAKKAIDDADIPGKAKNAWDTFKGWLGF